MTGAGPYDKFASTVSRLRSGRGLGTARTAAGRKLESADAAEAAEAKSLHEALTAYGEALLTRAEGASAVSALETLDEVQSLYAGDELAVRAKEREDLLRKDPKVQEEMKAHAYWAKLDAMHRQLKPYSGSRDPKSEGFRRLNAAALRGLLAQAQALQARHPETEAARRAAALLADYR
jgi:hypothetical protein